MLLVLALIPVLIVITRNAAITAKVYFVFNLILQHDYFLRNYTNIRPIRGGSKLIDI